MVAVLILAFFIDYVTDNAYQLLAWCLRCIGWNPVVAILVLITFFAPEGAIRLGPQLIHLGKRIRILRLEAKSHELHVGPKGIVLYLRSFETDGKSAEPSLKNALSKEAELFLIGRPNEVLPPLGGMRFYAGDDWHAHISQMVRTARIVIIRIGTSGGLAWEIGEVLKICDPGKVALMLESARRGQE